MGTVCGEAAVEIPLHAAVDVQENHSVARPHEVSPVDLNLQQVEPEDRERLLAAQQSEAFEVPTEELSEETGREVQEEQKHHEVHKQGVHEFQRAPVNSEQQQAKQEDSAKYIAAQQSEAPRAS